MTDKVLQAHFDSFMAICFPTLEGEEAKNIRRIFMGGALAALHTVFQTMDNDDTSREEKRKALDGLLAECNNYQAEVLGAAMKIMGRMQ